MDATKKVLDLMKLALDERTPPHEAANAAVGALRIIEEYKLLVTGKRVEVAGDILNKFTSPLFAEEVADSVDRVVGAFGKLADRLTPRDAGGAAKRGRGGRKRKYG